MSDLLYGRNAVREALHAGRRRFMQLSLATNMQKAGALDEIVRLAEQAAVPVERVERSTLDRQTRQANHQGVTLEASTYPYVELETAVELAVQRGEQVLLLLLDHIQDPQNLGTLLRTAEAVGAHGVLLPTRRAASVTPAVVSTSSGATEYLHIVAVANVAQTIARLKRMGVWVVGLDSHETAHNLEDVDVGLPLALVVGAEGAGLARLTRERCDMLARLPSRGQIASLNAAVAGSIALYHVWRYRARQEAGSNP
jgi:23S rRNA (guanosine2251-2'-O)-methyltransferase